LRITSFGSRKAFLYYRRSDSPYFIRARLVRWRLVNGYLLAILGVAVIVVIVNVPRFIDPFIDRRGICVSNQQTKKTTSQMYSHDMSLLIDHAAKSGQLNAA